MLKFLKKLFNLDPQCIESKKEEFKPEKFVVRKFLKSKKQAFNVYKTTVEITFTDDTKFKTVIPGKVDQSYTDYCGEYNAGEPRITTGLEMAKKFISYMDGNVIRTFVDDQTGHATKSVAGIPKSMKIVKTEDLEILHDVKFVVEEEHIIE